MASSIVRDEDQGFLPICSMAAGDCICNTWSNSRRAMLIPSGRGTVKRAFRAVVFRWSSRDVAGRDEYSPDAMLFAPGEHGRRRIDSRNPVDEWCCSVAATDTPSLMMGAASCDLRPWSCPCAMLTVISRPRLGRTQCVADE